MTIRSFGLGENGSEGVCDIWGLNLEINYLRVAIWTQAQLGELPEYPHVREALCMAGKQSLVRRLLRRVRFC